MLARLLFQFSVLVLLLSVPPLSAQQLQRQILEEIEVAPEGLTGEWQIGGQRMIVNARTLIDRRVAVETGRLAAVVYYEENGKNVALQIVPLPLKAGELSDGPYVFWKDDSTVEVVTFSNGKVQRKIHSGISKPLRLENLPGKESTLTLDPRTPVPPRSAWETPSRLLALSDLEGNYDHARSFLQKHGVIDDAGKWSWDDGHLVLIGDLVDRGQQVTELMWMIRRLEREAIAAGGQVHYVLGNHEAMVMAGDLRYIHPKYVFASQRIGIRYDQLYSETSELGRWWRSKNGVITVGDLMFVHGGYSPLLDQADLDMSTLNDRIRNGLAPFIPTGDSPATNPVAHQHGPFWYRGYFDQHAETWGKATPDEIGRILTRHQAKHIVIGHTVVDRVGPLDETGRVIGIDVKWSQPEKGEGLLQEDGKLWRLTMTGERQELRLNSGQ